MIFAPLNFCLEKLRFLQKQKKRVQIKNLNPLVLVFSVLHGRKVHTQVDFVAHLKVPRLRTVAQTTPGWVGTVDVIDVLVETVHVSSTVVD